MKTLSCLLCLIFSISSMLTQGQNVGIGTTSPTEKLEVIGNAKAQRVIANEINAGTLTSGSITTSGLHVLGGSAFDFLISEGANGHVTFRKGHGAVAIRYIIAVGGAQPQTTGTPNYDSTFVGEIKLFAGNIAPVGWLFCEGQILARASFPALFNVIGYDYGGGGPTFALPNLNAAAPVGTGTSIMGYTWEKGEVSY